MRDVTGGTNYFCFYDANGNLGQLVDRSAGSLDARYEYDPYGNVTSEAGTYAAKNRIRFSTKYWDAEIALGYWGRRYYRPDIGRWLNRDPIEEMGGENLYTYVRNRPNSLLDGNGALTLAPGGSVTEPCPQSGDPTIIIRLPLYVYCRLFGLPAGICCPLLHGSPPRGKHWEYGPDGQCEARLTLVPSDCEKSFGPAPEGHRWKVNENGDCVLERLPSPPIVGGIPLPGRRFTNSVCRAACDAIYGNNNAAKKICYWVCKTLKGKTCNQLWSYCMHLGRALQKQAAEVCLILYNYMCGGK